MTGESMAPCSRHVGCSGGQSTAVLSTCLQSSLLRVQFPGFCPNLLADSPWLPPGHSNSHVLLSNKGTWNDRRWVRPSGQSGGRASESAFADLSGDTGLLALPSPQLDPWFAQLGLGNYRVTSQGHQAASLGWIPQAQGSTGPAASTPQFFLLAKPLPPLPPFSLVLHSHLSPLASESIL